MNPIHARQQHLSRRQFISHSAAGLGTAALAYLLARNGLSAATAAPSQRFGGLPGLPNFAPKAKRVIHLFMSGGPTHVDLFDWKPRLQQMHGEVVPPSYVGDKIFSTMTGEANGKVMLAPIEPFRQHGQSGAWVSNFLPHTAKIVDELCFIKSLRTDSVNHAPAVTFMLTGAQLPGRPTLGAWLSYGLGSETEELPAFVVLTSVNHATTCGQTFNEFYWGNGFLPSRFQGVKFRGGREPVLYLENAPGISPRMKREVLNAIAQINSQQHHLLGDPEITTRIAQYEMAARMQMSVPELADFSAEPPEVLASYGPEVNRPGSFAHNCVMARRLIERGSRYIQLMHAGWDQHNSVTTELYDQCRDTDQPSAALVSDLKRLGLLDDTLVIWGGEFGRTPFIQGNLGERHRWGRDHHPYAFTSWLAGGGVKPGFCYGETDDLGFNVIKDPVHVHDFQATILHLLGLDHTRLTFRFQGRDFRLTDVHGNVVHDIIA
ncbi:DUF1501 domain-containing protein [Oleiharenicola lentus]|uniref:DUF1501 domain-containing protein n=1 Tax=Oleiharenicola lentus TaxID=2508720 RepID=A0A4Q1CBN6_9BACT|nr:DUF1501 domain-containing protein [Oleiharenicola lentus]RXK56390.1 DUF1501 domain-containing protein [Oleiharenicola lentus]